MALDISCEAWLLEQDPFKQDRIIAQAAEDLQIGHLKILQLVQWIGPYVTQIDDVVQNGRAVEYFASIILKVQLETIARHDVDMLAGWFTSRIDHMGAPGLKDCFRALTHMATLPKARFTDERATGSLLAIFKNSGTEMFPKLPVGTRLVAYEYIEVLLSQRIEVAKDLGDRFVEGVLAMGDQEKDPRNLMKWFPIIRTILSFPNLAKFQTELWEGISRYFPITYKGGDSIGITPEDLKLELRGCIAGSSIFSTQALSFLTEKLDDQVSANIKKDVIRTMEMCMLKYDLASVAEWSTKLLDVLKYEILNVVDEDLAVCALSALAEVSRRLSFGILIDRVDGTPLMRYTHAVIKEFDSYLLEVRQKFVPQAGRILTAVAGSSDLAFDMVMKQILPRLLTVFSDTKSATHRNDQMVIIVALIQAPCLIENQRRRPMADNATDKSQSNAVSYSKAYLVLLEQFRSNLFELFTEIIVNQDDDETLLKITAIQGMLHLVELPDNFLSDAEVGTFIGILCNIVANVDQSQLRAKTHPSIQEADADTSIHSNTLNPNYDLSYAAVPALKRVAQLRPKVAMIVATPQLFGYLPKVLESGQDEKQARGVLEAIAAMSSQYENHLNGTSDMVNSYYREINATLVQEFGNALRRQPNQVYARMILAGLLRGVKLRQPDTSTTEAIPEDHVDDFRILIHEILQHVVESTPIVGEKPKRIVSVKAYEQLTSNGTMSVSVEDATLELVGKICMTAIRWETPAQQKLDGQEALTLYTTDREGVASEEIATVLSGGNYVKLQPFIVSRYILAALIPDTILSFEPQSLCVTLMRTYMSNGPDSSTGPLSQLVSDALLDSIIILINKWKATLLENKSGEETPTDVLRSILTNLPDTAAAGSHAIRLAVVSTMAANLRGAHREAQELMLLLTKLSATSRRVAQQLGLICQRSDILTKEYFGVIRGISISRPFHICVPELRKMYQNATADSDDGEGLRVTDVKTNLLIAFIGIVGNSPVDTIMSSIEEIFPMLLMTLQDESVGTAGHVLAISLLRDTLQQKTDLLKEHLGSVVKAMIRHIINRNGSTANTRREALLLLREIPDKADLVSECRSLKRQVSRTLDLAVADPVRDVREEAVKCRRAWLDKVVLPQAED